MEPTEITPQPQETIQPVLVETVDPKVERGSKNRGGFVWGVIITLVILSVGIAAAWKMGVIEFLNEEAEQPVVVVPSTLPLPSATPEVIPTSEVTWFSTPKSMAGLVLFKPQAELSENEGYYLTDSVKYTQLAELADMTKLVKAEVSIDAPGGSLVIKCLIHPDETKECLMEGLDPWTLEALPNILNPEVSLTDKVIDGLVSPDLLMVKGARLKKIQSISDDYSMLTEPKLLEQTEFGGVYQTADPISDNSVIGARGIYLRLKDNSLVIYQPVTTAYGEAMILSVSNASYTQGLMPGCGSRLIGSLPIYVGSENLDAKLTKVETSDSEQELYKITDTSSELMRSVYSVYTLGREGSSQVVDINTFAQQPNHVLWRDTLGDWQVFLNDEYAPMVECGKPVIYLYPETQTEVSVQVGAKIRVSDPLYPSTGWRVTAFPNGKLMSRGKIFPYLFWEGVGNGAYPDYRKQGVVVSQKMLVSTLYHQLMKLGLTQKEQADFMEFWQPRLPQTPFVRLTWLGNREMDILAPLTVSPPPDTSIRVFLEFEGLKDYKTLSPQRLSAPARIGFTLVEWGGLLVGGQ